VISRTNFSVYWRQYAEKNLDGSYSFRVPIEERWEAAEIARKVCYIPLKITSRVVADDSADGTFISFTARELTAAEEAEFRAGSWAPADVIVGTAKDVSEGVKQALAPGSLAQTVVSLGVVAGVIWVVKAWKS